jgi:outer membrane autotransporter protein
MVSTMQLQTLHDRQSQAPGVMGASSGADPDANAWVRLQVQSDTRTGAESLDTAEGASLIQAGGDLVRFTMGEGSLRFGAMGSYGQANNRIINLDGLTATGRVRGASGGLYGTWYGHADPQTGPYVDSWVMAGSFNNRVSGQSLPSESYHSTNLAASIEGGYSFPIYANAKHQLFLEPEAQVLVSDYQAGTHTEQNGTVVSGQSDTSVTTRLGVRLHGSLEEDVGMSMRPFAELNWWHGPSEQSIAFNGIRVVDPLPASRVEGKVGLQANLSTAVSLWSSLGYQVAEHDYHAAMVQMGVKVAW